jgi:hypothetical protein
MSAPLFVLPGLSEEPFTPPSMAEARAVPATEFDLEDVVVGRSVMTGMTTSGKIATGVVSRVIRGCGFAFDSPYQNGIIWQQMWLHDDDCPVAARLAAEEAAPKGTLRRTDSGCDYGMFGYPDCAFWERAGVDPLFVATEHHYGPLGDPSAEVRDRRVLDELRRREPTEAEGAYRRAWERQSRDVAAEQQRQSAQLEAAESARSVTPPVSPRAPFQEPLPLRGDGVASPLPRPSRPATPPVTAVTESALVTPPRLTRPVEPDAPARPLDDEERIVQAFGRLPFHGDAASWTLKRLAEMVAEADALIPPPWSDRPLERQVAAAAHSDEEETEEDVVDGVEMVRRLRFADVLAAPLPMTVGQGCAVFVAVVAILWMYAVCLAHR